MKKANEKKRKISMIKRMLSYGIDWYLGSVLSSLPIIILYLGLYPHAKSIAQNLLIFPASYRILAGVLSLSVSMFYYVGVPLFLWPGQTVGKKLMKLKIVDYEGDEASYQQIIIRQFVMCMIVESSMYTVSGMMHQMIYVITHLSIGKMYNTIGLVVTLASGVMAFFLPEKRALHDYVARTALVTYNVEKNSKCIEEKHQKRYIAEG